MTIAREVPSVLKANRRAGTRTASNTMATIPALAARPLVSLRVPDLRLEAMLSVASGHTLRQMSGLTISDTGTNGISTFHRTNRAKSGLTNNPVTSTTVATTPTAWAVFHRAEDAGDGLDMGMAVMLAPVSDYPGSTRSRSSGTISRPA